jgi:23S rRNA (adenine2503-C2)-methyltransferase
MRSRLRSPRLRQGELQEANVITQSPINLAELTSRQFAEIAHARGVSRPDALAIYRAGFRERRVDESWVTMPAYPVVAMQQEAATTKFILRHHDGLETESVILPIAGSTGRMRNTLCVSSQVGCAMGCRFCETAQMGLMKNLSAAQIVAQWVAASALIAPPLPSGEGRGERSHNVGASTLSRGHPHPNPSPAPPQGRGAIDNIVFMGMGEPMDNLDNVIQAIAVLSDQNGASIAPARISVSTVGIARGIERLAEIARTPGFRKLRLAVSVNAPNDEIRSRIMPINRATPMAELMQAMLRWPTEAEGGAARQRVFIEYVLIPGVNDALEHADELCHYLKPLRCTVNVIPYNPRRDSPWPAPSEKSVRAFVQRVHDNGQFVKRRQTMGRSVMAACGQLGNPAIRRRKFTQMQVAGEFTG